ncbi:MAG TPA: AAA family ATPase [Anaeromyxobacter sp.]|nr:AAA family ATPase [Anaeromyxobacter sp.]
MRALRALFVDDDTGKLRPESLPVPPSIVVESKNGIHAYWKLAAGEPLDGFTAAQVALAGRFGTDRAVKDLPRVLRVPGFLHMKEPSAPFMVRVPAVWLMPSRTYTIREVVAGSCGASASGRDYRVLSDHAGADTKTRARAWLAKRDAAIQGNGGDQHTFTTIAQPVKDYDLSDEDAWEILAEWNHRCEPPWEDADLRAKITNARKYGKHDAGAKLDRCDAATVNATADRVGASSISAPGAVQGTSLLEASEIFAPLSPVNWVCQALDVAPGAPLLFAGYGFSGKTLAAQDFALAVATGTPAWGAFAVRSGRVLHLDYEQGAHLTRMRYQRLARARGIAPDKLTGRLSLAVMPRWYLDSDTGDELSRLAQRFDLLIVDSFRAACPHTDENSSEARIPLDRLTRISEATGVMPVVIHHARKPTKDAQGGARMTVRGSGALYDACGSVLVFAANKGEPATVMHEKARITDRTHQNFQLWIEDVEIGGDPAAGLRVSWLAAVNGKNKPDSGRPIRRVERPRARAGPNRRDARRRREHRAGAARREEGRRRRCHRRTGAGRCDPPGGDYHRAQAGVRGDHALHARVPGDP